jgi:glycosyltransferase involved in cell wall biosynthesis
MSQKNKVKIISIGRFHHFHLARQLSKHNLFDCIYSGYPKFKLKNEKKIIPEKIISYSFYVILYRLIHKFFNKLFPDIANYFNYVSHKKLSLYVKKQIKFSKILIASSGSGLEAGKYIKRENNGIFICDRSSSHILYQKKILSKEYKKLNLDFNEMYDLSIERELEEYKIADIISVPSKFVFNSFVKMGVNKKKLFLNPFGIDLKRFKPNANKLKKNKDFTILYVGSVSVRKGVIYLLEAFKSLNIKNKKLILIGSIQKNMRKIFNQYLDDRIISIPYIKNSKLKKFYSEADVFVQPSLEEGLSLVILEALACGCPVIATKNTGAEDIFINGSAGYIVNSCSSNEILKKLKFLEKNKFIRKKFSLNGLKIVKKIKGWDNYGNEWSKKIKQLNI